MPGPWCIQWNRHATIPAWQAVTTPVIGAGGRVAPWKGFLPGWRGVQPVPANGGCCFPPIRMAQSFLDEGRLFRVNEGPGFLHPACMVFPREADSEVLHLALPGLHEQAAEAQAVVPV